MVATRRTVRASTSPQRQRRVVERATPPRPKRSRSVSTVSATRDAAGLPPRTRARRVLLATAAEPATLRRSSSPARSNSDRGVSVDPPPTFHQPSPLRRVAVEHSPAPADLMQWRRGIFDRLPRLDTVLRNYADLRASLQAVELAVQAPDRPADAFHIIMQQLHPRLQAPICTCMTAQPDLARPPYEYVAAILIQQVAPGNPEDYLHQTIALRARRTDTQISRLHMQFTVAYDAYRDLCARLRSAPHLGEHFVVTGFLENLPKDIAGDTRNQASAADRLNDLHPRSRTPGSTGAAAAFRSLVTTPPGRGRRLAPDTRRHRPAADGSAARERACRPPGGLLRRALSSRLAPCIVGNLQPYAPGHAPADSVSGTKLLANRTCLKFLNVPKPRARWVLTSLPQGQSSLTGLADRVRQEQLGGPAVTGDQVECLVGFWLSSAERLTPLMGPGRASLREFFNGVYRTGQALLRSTVATSAPPRGVAAPGAPHEPGAVARPAGPDSPSAPPGTPDVTTPPPPLPALLTEEFRLPEPSVGVRDPPQQLGMDGLLNGSAGRSPADDVSSAADDKGKGSAAELSGVKQPAPKRARTPGR
ncbi:hypothetical protein Emag_007856 [Eimeria magna]